MKKRVFIFVWTVLAGLLIAPLVNVLQHPGVDLNKWLEKKNLYNVDFAAAWSNFLLYQLGISTHPNQVVIGLDGWLYLGDNYAQTRTVTRNGVTTTDLINSQKISAANRAWGNWLRNKGVQLFPVMVGPNKASIYPEHLPVWAKPASTSATDALIASTEPNGYIDLKAPLLAAKTAHRQTLYYRTDTHWNSLGAGVAFLSFARNASRWATELRWPNETDLRVTSTKSHPGGDLSGFLRIQARVSDTEPFLAYAERGIETRQYDFDSGQQLGQGGNPKLVTPRTPQLIVSDGALNSRKVLWLRDSFGEALAPLMATTFSQTLQLHWQEALKPGGRFVELVEKWKPDYVVITVVERDAYANAFSLPPPLQIMDVKAGFQSSDLSTRSGMHDIVPTTSPNQYRLNGPDPYIEYVVKPSLTGAQPGLLKLQLSCADSTEKVPVQLFWLKGEESQYSEEQSVRFELQPGERMIDLRTAPGWLMKGAVHHLRLDIDSDSACMDLKLANPILGIMSAD